MKRRTRRIMVLVAFLVFIGATYIAIMYATGYRYNFSEHVFVQTGAVSLTANTDAKVFLNDKLVGSTSFIGSSYSINRLLPGQYKIRLIRDGYSTWQKTVTVEQGRLADYPHVLLLSTAEEESQKLITEIVKKAETDEKNNLIFIEPPILSSPSARKPGVSPTPTASASFEGPVVLQKGILSHVENNQRGGKIADKVLGYALNNDRNAVAWWTSREIWIMWLNETNYQPFHKAYDQELITRFTIPIEKVIWYPDQDHVVVEASKSYRIFEIDTRGGINNIKL